MVKIIINNKIQKEISAEIDDDLYKNVANLMHLSCKDFYLEQNGKRLNDVWNEDIPIYVRLCVLGGKGGFGSMLRAIGAQIEKTTNREACRDLSGRRLRDINEEKRLKAWLEKQGEREREAEERKKRKIEKLLAVPKHEFKDEEYEEARLKLTEKVCDAVEEGFKKASGPDLRRKNEASTSQKSIAAKKKKTTLWLDDEISSGDDSESSDDESDTSQNSTTKNLVEKESTDSNSSTAKSQESDSNLDSGCDSISSKQLTM
ncbi:splicing regulator SDE2 [Cochliomyia hominivorax]